MLDSLDLSGRPFHFIGIGGIGMSALAYILTRQKLPVSGSDLRLSHITQRLQEEGAHIFWSQDATNLEFFSASPDKLDKSERKVLSNLSNDSANIGNNQSNGPTAGLPGSSPQFDNSPMVNDRSSLQRFDSHLPQVICSTAINPNNAEYQAAIELGCPIFHRSDLLAALIKDYQSIAVAGTHGKTTTSSLIAYLLLQTGFDPTIIIGGEVPAWQGNARLGCSDLLVAEADESDGSLAKLSAHIGVVTNIELDHPDHYNNLDEVLDVFRTFSNQCQTLVGCIDCPSVRQVLQPDITYSLHRESGADYTADEVEHQLTGTTAKIWERGQLLGTLRLPLMGQHNLSNALAAIAVGRHLGIPFMDIAEAIKDFQGARRRFERRGFCNGILFIDDYAHHPSEIEATLSAAKIHISEEFGSSTPKRIIAVFQPHRYSRAIALGKEFAQAFGAADQVIVTDIYSAGEPNVHNITGRQVAEMISAQHSQTDYQASLPEVQKALTETLQPGDVVLFLTAGNLNQIIPDLIAFYEQTDLSNRQEACHQA
ncbi:MAG: UDP-N-acetylmuramate--L-alanine ligase [Leptolyngbyaceae cyanobacterium MO_188.B28]|nr:UDP-N-acetylmuramate--L-alanine ligase [Leptolyngbyaceae cyanobacterium MO_188.B28]